ncbi:ribonuclease inhibitor [Flavobacteriaceae bacterium MHTCC 0001]
MNETPDFVLFLGRFHPLVVHLPIGFLMFAFFLELLGRKEKFKPVTAAIPVALCLGFGSAVVACILGYMLSLSGDYEEAMLDNHFWFGVLTTVIVFIAWLIRIDKIKLPEANKVKANVSALTLIIILISVTGHYGGNLTHGSDYLTKYAPFNNNEKEQLVKIEKVEDAVVFNHLVQPILDDKCMGCHSKSKKKGGLSFQDSLSITKGGKTGETVVAGKSSDSEMIKRVLLDPEHEDFMPPEGKTPLTEEEVAILTYWIDNAHASFSSKIAVVETPENVMHIASNMLGIKGVVPHRKNTSLPSVSVIEDAVIQDIKSEGFNVRELVFDSNIFEVVLPSYNTHMGTDDLSVKLEKLSKIKDNILWLYIEDNDLQNNHLQTISAFKNLQKLVINRNPVEDSGINHLTNLKSLTSLNVYGTKITDNSLPIFSKIQNLEKVYAWDTKITESTLKNYKSDTFPDIIIAP